MAVTRAALKDIDIHSMVRCESADDRAVEVHKFCRAADEAELTDAERAYAHQILRILAADATELVRRAVAVTLKASPLLPRDVALKLARDMESVATPVLSFSPAFTDEDLVEIINSCGPVRQIAVAKRAELSEAVTTAIAEHGAEAAVRIAASNDNARFTEAGLQKAVTRFASSQELLSAVAYRKMLPLSVTERLVSMVGDKVRDHLVNHHALSPETALQIALGARERATIDLVDQAGMTTDVAAFVSHLAKNERLTASLLLRVLAHGHIAFFEWGLAELAQLPHHRAWLMIHDAGPLGLRAIYERAGLPSRLFNAFRAGVDTYHSMDFDGGPRDRERFQSRMLQRFLTTATATPRDDVDYLLDKMDKAPSKPGRAARKPVHNENAAFG
ncbi:MAG: DUF2336 domain-containing protein [Caulobacteraceae bacterium]